MGPSRREKRAVVFSFSGRLQAHGNAFVATCDHAPLVTQGIDEDEALARMEHAIGLYLQTLDARGEIQLAIGAGLLHAGLAEDSFSEQPSARLSRTDGGFKAELAAV